VALIEVLVATVVLAVAGTGLITMLGQTRHTMRDVETTERLFEDASQILDHLTILDKPALAARVGRFNVGPSPEGAWTLSVARVGQSLFDVTIAPNDSLPPILHTTLYRPEADDGSTP
jgi:hypothetical protein